MAQRIRNLEVRGLKCWFPSSCQMTRKCLKALTHVSYAQIEIHMYIFKKRESERAPNTSGYSLSFYMILALESS